MKHMMNKVNPKAGTLKQTNESTIQNVSRKLIAFVLMLALTLQPGLTSAVAGELNSDSCCSTEKKDKVNNIIRVVRVDLPSNETVKKADSEMNRNMYRSLRESKITKLASAFEQGDAEINRQFAAETHISTPVAKLADEIVNIRFMAENINLNNDLTVADSQIDAFFTANEKGIVQGSDVALADEWMTISFQAQNISLPNAEALAKADMEINKMMSSSLPLASK